MSSRRFSLAIRVLPITALVAQLGGCASSSSVNGYMASDEQECMARVMYFESLRSSEDGMRAVGTVVMNRLESGRYPSTVCAVVGQKNQFAPGAVTLPMNGRGAALARRVAAEVMAGYRHPALAKNVMFFHTAGYHFPYTNMRYVLAAGGNVFYYKDNSRYPGGGSAAPASAALLAYAPEAGTPATPQPTNEEPPALATTTPPPTEDAAQPSQTPSASSEPPTVEAQGSAQIAAPVPGEEAQGGRESTPE